jgi:hypothetical protein
LVVHSATTRQPCGYIAVSIERVKSEPTTPGTLGANENELPQTLPPVAIAPPPGTPIERALLSVVLPGLGQFAQRRFLTGAVHLGTVLAYTATAYAFGGRRAALLAVAWNVWSAIDAYRHERE